MLRSDEPVIPSPRRSSDDTTNDRASTLLSLTAKPLETCYYNVVAWNLEGQDPPQGLKGLNLRYGCSIYAFQVTNCRSVSEFEWAVRELIGDEKDFVSYVKSMGKSPHITSLLVFASTPLVLARQWECLDGSVKSAKWQVKRGPKNMFGTRSTEYGAVAMAFQFKSTCNLVFVGIHLPKYKGSNTTMEEMNQKRSHDVHKILTKLPYEMSKRRRTPGGSESSTVATSSFSEGKKSSKTKKKTRRKKMISFMLITAYCLVQ